MAALAVLQAITSAFTPRSTRSSSTASAYARTSAIGLGPYGECAVSPTYRIDSCGSWSMIARATVRPPTPLSKTPMGASMPGVVMGIHDTGGPLIVGSPHDRRPADDCPADRPLRAD